MPSSSQYISTIIIPAAHCSIIGSVSIEIHDDYGRDPDDCYASGPKDFSLVVGVTRTRNNLLTAVLCYAFRMLKVFICRMLHCFVSK